MGKNTSIALWILIVILGILVLGYLSSLGVFEKIRKTGQAPSKAETIATIATYFEISLSANLTDPGIEFDIQSLPTNDNPGQNATLNYNVTTQETLYWVYNWAASNTPVDLCVRANNTLIGVGGVNKIGIANYTWANSTTNDVNNPSIGNFKAFFNSSENSNDIWDDGSYGVAINGYSYFRFWLNVSDAQPADVYRTWVEFKAIDDDNAC
jgi:hypothetical protein